MMESLAGPPVRARNAAVHTYPVFALAKPVVVRGPSVAPPGPDT